ncbi:hypothetical protein [Foetidibacter luteolus]|uniref:hypothetical protein n=1 Tax=Foetidibacter luteolus TaxID=2608880 RepID=UPI00129B5418|nr:hypothetical protein [Foetidibacter luteolus]
MKLIIIYIVFMGLALMYAWACRIRKQKRVRTRLIIHTIQPQLNGTVTAKQKSLLRFTLQKN